jgi:hypothetical protein
MHGFEDAGTDEDQIRAWWSMWPSSNVGIATGSGLVVVDVDPRHDGDRTLADLVASREMPTTPTVRTGGGGLHLYYTGEVPRVGTDALGRGVDVKAQGGYVVAPPSVHGSGGIYEWENFGTGPAPLPEWLAPAPKATPLGDLLTVEPGKPLGGPYAAAALQDEYQMARARRDGQRRRSSLYESGLKLSRFVISGDMSPEELTQVLACGGAESGLSYEVAAAHVRNGLNQGLRNGVRHERTRGWVRPRPDPGEAGE